MIRYRLTAALFLAGAAVLGETVRASDGPKSAAPASFRGKLVLFGAQRVPAESGRVEILMMNPDGTALESLGTWKDVGRMTGRVSPDGRRLAFGIISADQKRWETWIRETDGRERKLPVDGVVRAWSPDGASLACFRLKGDHVWESVRVEVESGRVRPLPVPATEVVDDWATDGALAVMNGNHGQTLDEPVKGVYPLRQIEVMALDGSRRQRVTTDPLLDNIWSRFSPDGSRLAHEQRRVEPKTARVFCSYVVRRSDGSQSVEVVRRDRLDDDLHVVASYPSYPFYWDPAIVPCWSPDGSRLVVCLDNYSWTQRHGRDKWRWALVFVTLEGRIERTLDLTKKLGIVFVCEIDWK